MKNSKLIKIVISGLLVVFGIISLIKPFFLYDFISYILGSGLVIYGFIMLMDFFKAPKEINGRYYGLVGGVTFMLSGIALIIIPISIIQTVIGLVAAIGLLLISFVLVTRALIERPHFDGWIIRLLIGVITFFGSMIVFSNLSATSEALARIIGGVSIYIGINNILGMILIKNKSKDDSDKIDIDFTK